VSPGAPKGRSRRRSARLQLNIPVRISLASGDEAVAAETVTVSKYGAKVRLGRLPRRMTRGETLCVTIPDGEKSRVGRIVWVDEEGGGHCGIEFKESGDFWGVYFPAGGGKSSPEEEKAALEAVREFEAARSARARSSVQATPLRSRPEPMPLPVEAAPAVEVRAILDTPAFDTNEAMGAVITGLSAVRTSFSERTLLSATEGDEVTALLTKVIEPGVKLRIITSDDRLLTARVMAVSDKREGGKWRIWLKLVSSRPVR
jgi:hypothetical protein